MVRTLITNADAATFEMFKLAGPTDFARDKNHVYMYGEAVAGAQPDSFRRFAVPAEPHYPRGANFYYYRDAQHVFVYPFSNGGMIAMLPDSDPDSFSIITNGALLDRTGWARDRSRVYLFDMGFAPEDIATFEPLAKGWSRDSKAYYWFTNEIAGADRDTFQITGSGTGYDLHYSFQVEEIWNANHRELQKVILHKQPR